MKEAKDTQCRNCLHLKAEAVISPDEKYTWLVMHFCELLPYQLYLKSQFGEWNDKGQHVFRFCTEREEIK